MQHDEHATGSEILSLADLSAILPRQGGKRVHRSTIIRWWQRGIRGARLDLTRIGGRLYCSRASLSAFLGRLNATPALEAHAKSAVAPSGPQRRQRIAAAEARLRARGVLQSDHTAHPQTGGI